MVSEDLNRYKPSRKQFDNMDKKSLKGYKFFIPFDLVILLQGIYPKEIIRDADRDLCTKMFTTALFIMIKSWKQPICPALE